MAAHDRTGPGKAASRVADVPAAVQAALDAGTVETRTLVEALAVDFSVLARTVAPELSAAAGARLTGLAGVGISRRMAETAALLLDDLGADAIDGLMRHPADTVRGWAAYMIAALPGLGLGERLDRLQPLADDPHFGVREWAWLAVRPAIARDVGQAIHHLTPWTGQDSERLRRYAVEATRPRGVWATHIASLKQQPALGLPLLEPLRADPARYVQDSVGNWLNDAAKDQPAWVEALCRRWRTESPGPATARIVARACRGLPGA